MLNGLQGKAKPTVEGTVTASLLYLSQNDKFCLRTCPSASEPLVPFVVQAYTVSPLSTAIPAAFLLLSLAYFSALLSPNKAQVYVS